MVDLSANKISAETNNQRKKQLFIAATFFASIILLSVLHWLFISRYQEVTDDAYVSGNIVQVTPQTTGTVVAIYTDDTQFVKAGQPLIKLDDTDAQVYLAGCEAELAQTVRQVNSLFTSNATLRARVDLQQVSLSKAKADLKRRKKLGESGAVSSEELYHSEAAVKAAQADLLGAQEALSANLSLTENTTIANHPQVKAAAARVKAAFINIQRAVILAPIDGYVAKRRVQLGQHVVPGEPLMAVIPLEQVWVDANFKEHQLNNIRIGQTVTLNADMYGSDFEYQGHIVGLAAGTGSAFSILPPQNATGNWIKVVQRLPVRIALDTEQVKKYPLRIGLSMSVTVDTSNTEGSQLSTVTPSSEAVYKTSVYDNALHDANKLVATIIQNNLSGHKSKMQINKTEKSATLMNNNMAQGK